MKPHIHKFGSWRPCSVKGRAKKDQHRKGDEGDDGDDGEMKVPRVSSDYFFIGRGDEKAFRNPLLIMVDEGTGEKYARAGGQKGLGVEKEMDLFIKDASEELKSWGHLGGVAGQMIMKCDE